MYIYTSKSKNDIKKTIQNSKLMILYHELCSTNIEESDQWDLLRKKDILKYVSGGQEIPTLTKKIKTQFIEFETTIPTEQDIKKIINFILDKENNLINNKIDGSKRKTYTKLNIIAYSAFYQLQIPPYFKEQNQDCDHIIPYSVIENDKQQKYNINRLGNLQLIPSKMNKDKSNNPITDKWIKDNNLQYQDYPSELEYNEICKDVKIINIIKYNEMCEKREKLYIEMILKLLKDDKYKKYFPDNPAIQKETNENKIKD
jgi:hypothetical protein